MAIQFPASPTLNQQLYVTGSGITYVWNGTNWVNTLATGSGVVIFKAFENRAASGTITAPNNVPNWTYNYTGNGKSVMVTVDCTSYSTSAASTVIFQLQRDGVTIGTTNQFFNNIEHLPISRVTGIVPNEVGLHTYSVRIAGTARVDSGDICTMVIQEF